jgi:dienelactone hydrolase
VFGRGHSERVGAVGERVVGVRDKDREWSNKGNHMPESEHTLSRRRFLEVAGLGTAAALGACALSNSVQDIAQNPNIAPSPTPIPTPPFRTGTVILGETAGTTALEQPFQPGGLPISPDAYARLPKRILATVHYPTTARSSFPPPTRNPLNPLNVAKGPFPVLLYAHALRVSGPGQPFDRDFTSVDAMLRSVASWGCVCVAPDLSWLGTLEEPRGVFNFRATVLVSYYTYLADALNATLFAKQVDVSRIVLVGHSHGAAGATNAGRVISGFGHHLNALAYGLIAPELGGDSRLDLHNLLVLGGTLDIDQGAQPQSAFDSSGTPKTLVMIPGANHYGYTDICPPDNSCNNVGLFDENGTISRTDQQRVGEEYLAALVRYNALGDGRALPYLNGTRIVEGLESLNLQVQAQGFVTRPTPPVPQNTHTPVIGP